MIPIIKPKQPSGEGWYKHNSRTPYLDKNGYDYEIWTHKSGLGVISAVEVAEEEKQSINIDFIWRGITK